MPMTEDGVRYQDGELKLRDGRTLAWRWWAEPDGIPVLRLQGTPGCRLYRHPDPAVQRDLGVRYLLADRPGYGGSTRLPGRGVGVIAEDLAALLDHHKLDRVPVMGTSGGGPHALGVAADLPGPVSGLTIIEASFTVEACVTSKLSGLYATRYAAVQLRI